MLASTNIQELQQRISLYDDQSAYKELFAHFYKSLQQFAASFVRSPEVAEEVVSDIFIKVWKKRAGLNRIHNLKLYLFISTKNGALNYLRTRKKVMLQPEQYFVQLQSIYFNPEKLMLTAEMMNRVQSAINDLPTRCQLIFKLVKDDGLKYREVAELLHISLKTVENQMAIAIRKIGMAIHFDIRTTLSF
ncbi:MULTISPECIES: RNA polymerase sigma-70 factor [Niastella]|uniref:RNA polymerase sigma-70 factor n=1 Tax=Niastella soli TaxID=2821487 RepID=A0ABS3YNR0_9BACT|nr:RNA polymerase sigma-70 factor [Niastella soli]MBO9199521.1 RNA polymerase sigma-70 factor [Niastella soli]